MKFPYNISNIPHENFFLLSSIPKEDPPSEEDIEPIKIAKDDKQFITNDLVFKLNKTDFIIYIQKQMQIPLKFRTEYQLQMDREKNRRKLNESNSQYC